MAYTLNRKKITVMGDMRCSIISCTADATTQSIDTGLSYVYGFSSTPVSMTAATVQMFPNVGAEATAMAGYIGASGLTNLDEFMLIAWGT